MRIMNLTCAAVLVAATGYAQDEAARRAATEVAARVPLERPVKAAPYSADTTVEGTQQLADGNRIARKTTGRVYRDSEGRTRREEDRPNGRTTISLTDPVAGFSYSLDPINKIAWRTPMGAAAAIIGKVEAAGQVSEMRKVEFERSVSAEGNSERRYKEPQVARGAGGEGAEARSGAVASAGGGGGGGIRAMMPTMNAAAAGPLERKVLEGVNVEGRKTTTTIPAGQIGNEQPLTITSEQWRSPELNVLVMTKHNDPRTGESTYRLQNIVRAEPDRSLFMVPADYTVKDSGVRKMLETRRN
jgi:hypothetical protein